MAESTGSNQVGTGGKSGNSGTTPDAYSSRDLSETASNVSEQAPQSYEQAKRSAADGYAQARQKITDVSGQAQQVASDWTEQTRSATETYVREKPWNAVGIAAAIGLLVGLILRR